MKLKPILIGAVASALALAAGTSMAADYGEKEFVVIGSWGNMDHWQQREGPFWMDRIPEVSGGALTANAKSYTELGLSGFEGMRMLKLGTADVVFVVSTYVSQDSPALEGADLPGLVSDLATYRKVVDAYRPIIEREINDKYNGKLLVIYSWPSQEMWCNMGGKDLKEVRLADLAGKKIRTYSTPLGDFIEGIGGSAVTIAFAEVVPALQKGVADCGITGTLPAYDAKWWQVVTHNIQVKLGYAASFMAINNDTWNDLTPDAQQLLLDESSKLEGGVLGGHRRHGGGRPSLQHRGTMRARRARRTGDRQSGRRRQGRGPAHLRGRRRGPLGEALRHPAMRRRLERHHRPGGGGRALALTSPGISLFNLVREGIESRKAALPPGRGLPVPSSGVVIHV